MPRDHHNVIEQQLWMWLDRGRSEVFTITADVGPELAKLLMSNNPDNRPLTLTGSVRSVQAYAAAMKRGEWRLNGEAIIVAATGELNDGQHRLAAIISAEVTIHMSLTFGVERVTRTTLDQGKARSPGDIMHMAQEKNSNTLAAGLRFLFCIDEGVTFGWRPSAKQIEETLVRHPLMREAVRDVLVLVREFGLSGVVSAGHYLCFMHREFEAQRFLAAVSTGLNIDNANTAVARLRRVYLEHRGNTHRKTPVEQVACYIKAYNHHLRGKLGPVVWKGKDEEFPVPGKFENGRHG